MTSRGAAAAVSAASRPAATPTPPTAFISGYLAYLLARASHLISSEFHETLRERGIPVMYWRVIASLHDGPMPISTVAEISLVKTPTMSKLLERMQREGLVTRLVDETDRRRVLVGLTAKGRRMAEPLVVQARDHEQSVLEPFGHRNADLLVDVLKRLIAMHAAPAGADGSGNGRSATTR